MKIKNTIMRKDFTIITFLILTLQAYSQNINQKRVIDLDLNSDFKKLKKIGYGEKELKILGLILTERKNKNKNVDTLTVKNCLPLIFKHKFYNNVFFKSIEEKNNFRKRDQLICFNDIITLENINKIDYGIILFCSLGSINCDRFLTDLNSEAGIQFLKKNTLYYYDLLMNEQFEYLVKKQKELLNSNVQPHFAVVKNGKIIKDFIGYKNLSKLIDKIKD